MGHSISHSLLLFLNVFFYTSKLWERGVCCIIHACLHIFALIHNYVAICSYAYTRTHTISIYIYIYYAHPPPPPRMTHLFSLKEGSHLSLAPPFITFARHRLWRSFLRSLKRILISCFMRNLISSFTTSLIIRSFNQPCQKPCNGKSFAITF